MSVRVGIMGFGRIGRNAFRIIQQSHPGIELVAIVDVADPNLRPLDVADDRNVAVEVARDLADGADEARVLVVEPVGHDPAMNDVDDDAVGVLDDARVVVVDRALGLHVGEEPVAAQAHRAHREAPVRPVHDVPVVAGLLDHPVAGARAQAEPAPERAPRVRPGDAALDDWAAWAEDLFQSGPPSAQMSDPARGLHRMVIDIATSLFRNLASVGVQFDAGFLNTLCSAYLRQAQDTISAYSDDSRINGLHFDPHAEELVVETFTGDFCLSGDNMIFHIKQSCGKELDSSKTHVEFSGLVGCRSLGEGKAVSQLYGILSTFYNTGKSFIL